MEAPQQRAAAVLTLLMKCQTLHAECFEKIGSHNSYLENYCKYVEISLVFRCWKCCPRDLGRFIFLDDELFQGAVSYFVEGCYEFKRSRWCSYCICLCFSNAIITYKNII